MAKIARQGSMRVPLPSGAAIAYTAPMPEIASLFVTRLYRAALAEQKPALDLAELDAACRSIAEDDTAGQDWCEANGYPGYTSYASLNDLPWRFPVFSDLGKALDRHAAVFARDLGFDLQGRKLKLDSLWVNVLPEGGSHASHIHPRSVISGTAYVAMPEGTSALKLEDPRLAMMMHAPMREKDAPLDRQAFVYLTPAAGEVLMWESWLRHEVPMNMAGDDRISVSFNYGWG
jgi:uncharacterized protein (TIGR02466 family)